MLSRRSLWRALLACASLVFALAAFAADPVPDAAYRLVLDKAVGDTPFSLAIVTRGGTLSYAFGVTGVCPVTGLTLKDDKLAGDITVSLARDGKLQPTTITLDAAIVKDALTGTYKATADGKAWEGTLAGTVGAAPRLGSKEFYPTTETPQGFRGDFTGNFPDATPVREFWEAPHVRKPNPAPAGGGGLNWPKEVTALDPSQPSHNLVWKTPMPGWSLAQPLVVGDRIFAHCEPHFLVCMDAHTGEVLWQREMLPFLADGMDEKRARELQEILDIARAAHYLVPSSNNKDILDANIARVEEWKERVKAIDPDRGVLASFDKVLERLRLAKEGKGEKFNGMSGGDATITNAVYRKYGITTCQIWFGILGYAQTTPVSDGTSVYVVGGQGQVACYDMDGNTKWFKRFPRPTALNCSHMYQPAVCGDTLLVSANGKANPALLALDKRTGEVRWTHELPWKESTYKTWALLYPRTPDGTVVPVAVVNDGNIVRVRDGKVMGKLDYDVKIWDFASLGTADLFVICNSWNTFPGAAIAFRMTAENEDTIRVERLHEIGDGVRRTASKVEAKTYDNSPAGEGIWAMTPGKLWYGGNVFDLKSGRALAMGLGTKSSNPQTIAGDLVIAPFEMEGANGYGPPARVDRQILGSYRVWDARNLGYPIGVSADNWLGLDELCHDIYVEKYLQGFDRWNYAGCYHGWPATFGGGYSGVTPAGNRLFIQSHSFVYCIGDPTVAYDGLPTQPEALAALAATDVTALIEQAKAGKTLRARILALDALGRLKAKDAFDAVRALTEDKERLVRQRAAATLPQLGDKAAEMMADLVKDLEGTDQAKMEVAAIVLHGLGDKAKDQAAKLAELAVSDDAIQRRWAGEAISGLGDAAIEPLTKAAGETPKLTHALTTVNALPGDGADKGRFYLSLIKHRDLGKVLGGNPGYMRVGHDMLTIPNSLRLRFALCAMQDKTLLVEYRTWLEAALANPRVAKDMQANVLMPLVLADPEGQQEFLLAELEKRLKASPSGDVFDLIKQMGARAAKVQPLLEDLAAGKLPLASGTQPWQAQSALDILKVPAR